MANLIGCDIEFAVMDRKTRRFVPAGVLPIKGTKGRPEKRKYGGFEIDCCGVELTPKPADNAEEFSGNIGLLFDDLKKTYSEFEFLAKDYVQFSITDLRETREAMTMGCDPDFNAWTMSQNPSINAVMAGSGRSFGGHLHIDGGTPATVVACDMLLGLWESSRSDYTPTRKLLYGQPGSYRVKPYGIEYRTLSNFWCDDDARRKWAFKYANIARKLNVTQIKAVMRHLCGVDNTTGWSYVQSCVKHGVSHDYSLTTRYNQMIDYVNKNFGTL